MRQPNGERFTPREALEMKAGVCRPKLAHLPTRLLPILLGVLAGGGLLLGAEPAAAVDGGPISPVKGR